MGVVALLKQQLTKLNIQHLPLRLDRLTTSVYDCFVSRRITISKTINIITKTGSVIYLIFAL
jgi:hypothetical protein